MAFALRIEPPRDEALAKKKLLGLTTALRLALTAQQAGAIAIVVENQSLRALLNDPRLRIPVVSARPSGASLYSAPAELVLHRAFVADVRARRGDADLSLADERFATVPPFGFDPILAIDPPSRARATKSLLRALRKPQDGWTSTYLNRHVSLFLTRFLVATPLRPNHVSIGILAIGLAGAWLASRGTYLDMLAGAFAFQVQSILDGCDGEMSRLTFRGSKTGEWLDTIGDDLTNYGFFAGAAYGLHHATANPIYEIAGAVVVTCGLLTSGIEYRYLITIGTGDLLKYPIGVGKAEGAKGSFFDVWIAPLFKRDTFVLLTLVAAALGMMGPMLLVFAIGAVGILATVIGAEVRMARERRGGGSTNRLRPRRTCTAIPRRRARPPP